MMVLCRVALLRERTQDLQGRVRRQEECPFRTCERGIPQGKRMQAVVNSHDVP